MAPFVPYLKITKITKHTADAMLQQFKDLECFSRRSTQKGKFAVIVKDNIDLNTRSSTATMDYHGTSLLLIQMHSEESECTVYNYIHTINRFPATVLTNLSDLAVYYAPKCSDPMEVQSLDFSILNDVAQQEIEWLDTTVALNHGWASYYASQK